MKNSRSGPPVLFIHGQTSSSALWSEIRSIVCADGWSYAPDLCYRMPYAFPVGELAEYLIDRKVFSTYVVAHGSGSSMAFALAESRPWMIRGLAFMEFPWPIYPQSTIACLCGATYPKLLIAGNPGCAISSDFARKFAQSLPNCELAVLRSAAHYLPASEPHAIGQELLRWIRTSER